MYILDEIYEKDQNNTATANIFRNIKKKMQLLYPNSDINDDWFKVYDEAGIWFANEVLSRFGCSFYKTEKRRGDKEEGLSLIKDQLIHEVVVISDKCEHLYNEMRMYAKDSKGKIPKKNDHLIDCYRYLLDASHYDFNAIVEAKRQIDPIEKGRYRGLMDDLRSKRVEDDWTLGFGDGYEVDFDDF
jgi:hypothetical protein